MNKQTDTKMKDLFENWEEQGSATDFNTEKVWKAIENEQRSRVFIPWFYSAGAAVALLFFFVGASYLFVQNNELKEQYAKSLVELNKQPVAPKVVVKKEVEVQYKTQLKEVVKESPELLAKYKELQKQLAEVQQEKTDLQNQLIGANATMKLLKDSVKKLKSKEVAPLFAENSPTPCPKEVGLSDIKVNINKKALAYLPIAKAKKKERTLKIKFREEKTQKSKKRMSFSRFALN